MPLLPDPDSWAWPQIWVPILDTLIEEDNGVGAVVLVTLVFSTDLEVNDGLSSMVSYNHFGKFIPFMSVFKYLRRYNDCLDGRRFYLVMSVGGIVLMVFYGNFYRLAATGRWAAGLWLL